MHLRVDMQHVFAAVDSGFRVAVAHEAVYSASDAVPAMRSQRLSMQGDVAGGT